MFSCSPSPWLCLDWRWALSTPSLTSNWWPSIRRTPLSSYRWKSMKCLYQIWHDSVQKNVERIIFVFSYFLLIFYRAIIYCKSSPWPFVFSAGSSFFHWVWSPGEPTDCRSFPLRDGLWESHREWHWDHTSFQEHAEKQSHCWAQHNSEPPAPWGSGRGF